jgi:acetyl esterase/lipase
MKILISILLVSMLYNDNIKAQQTIPLYDGAIPGSKPSRNKETSDTSEGILLISHVSVPTITIYRPAHPSAQKSAVIICPGGGYEMVAAGHEGADVARVFNDWGVTAFVLKYRLPDSTIMLNKTTGPLQDAQRAIQVVREHAAGWNIDASKIGIMGFSAGGHLAATASTHFNHAVIDNPKAISLRPDFSILIYPVISFTDSLAHMGSRNNLIGKNPSPDSIIQYSNELQVTTETPPAFLAHASDDEAVPVGNSIAYYKALLQKGIHPEMILFAHGGHGFGMNNETTKAKWMDNVKNWMIANKWL